MVSNDSDPLTPPTDGGPHPHPATNPPPIIPDGPQLAVHTRSHAIAHATCTPPLPRGKDVAARQPAPCLTHHELRRICLKYMWRIADHAACYHAEEKQESATQEEYLTFLCNVLSARILLAELGDAAVARHVPDVARNVVADVGSSGEYAAGMGDRR